MRTMARSLLLLALPLTVTAASPALAAAGAPAPPGHAAGSGVARPGQPNNAPNANNAPITATNTAPNTAISDATIARRQGQARAARERGRTLAAQGQATAALAAYRQALLAWPAYPIVHNEIGAILFARGDIDEAIAAFRKATELDPQLAAAWSNLAEAERRRGHAAQAAEHFRRAVALAPDDSGLYYGLAAAYLDAKDEAKAMWAMDRFLEHAPSADSPRAKAAKARRAALAARGVKPAALSAPADGEAASAGSTDPNVPPELPTVAVRPGEPPALARHRGDRYFAAQRYVEALSAYREELAKSPRDVTLLYKVGATHAVMGAYRAAARWWRLALAIDPGRALIARHLGLLALREGAAKEPSAAPAAHGEPVAAARADLIAHRPAQAAARLRGVKGAEAAYLRAEAALELGEYQAARGLFEALLKARPGDVAATGGLAVALTLLGDPKADDAMQRWLGDQLALPEDFLVLRAAEAASRIEAGPQALAPAPAAGQGATTTGPGASGGASDGEDFDF